MASQNLEQIAWDYLMSSPNDQMALGTMLVNAGAAAVFPLLRAGLRVVREFNPLRTPGVEPLDHEAAKFTWVYNIAEPMLANIHAVVNVIGQPAYDVLCRALWDKDEQVKILAAAILLQEARLSERTVKQIEEIFREIASTKDWNRDRVKSILFIALSNTLARSGDKKHQELVQLMMREQHRTAEQVIETTRNTLLLHLIR